ncbi:hypothetical protein EAF04_004942 [Stromatinia cepivora]|nr:hypothetical protein EAF04_004942 [Stromatinia cepivora]
MGPIPPTSKFRVSTLPPAITLMDHAILQKNGVTTAIKLGPQSLQASKRSPALNLRDRIEELTRENGRLRHEVQYFRRYYDTPQEYDYVTAEIYKQICLTSLLGCNKNEIVSALRRLFKAIEKPKVKKTKRRIPGPRLIKLTPVPPRKPITQRKREGSFKW